MSETEQYTTFADLYTAVLNATRSQTTQANTKVIAKRMVNTALHDMHLGTEYQFYWAERSAFLTLQPPYSTGTITLSVGGTTVTGDSTAWDTAGSYGTNNVEVGWKIKFAGSEVVYTITAIASDTSLTIDPLYTGTALSGETYVAWKDAYAPASDYTRPVDMQFFDDNHEIRIVDRHTMKREFPRNSDRSRPRWVTQIELGPSGSTALRPRLRFAPPPDQVYSIPYSYITNLLAVDASGTGLVNMSADTDEPIVPLRYRGAIFHKALMGLYEHKDNQNYQIQAGLYQSIMTRTLSDITVGDRRMRLEPNNTHYLRRAQSPYTGRGRRQFDTEGKAFDRMERPW